MAKQLTPNAKLALDQASIVEMDTVFAGLQTNFVGNEWLSAANPYRSDCVNKIFTDIAAGGVNSPNLAQYIAASGPLHCADGWTFLARSLDCYINGSPHQAAHFAYYAELRAAMSILATQGIGVFNNVHFIVNGAGVCVRVPQSMGTHDFTWAALDHWTKNPSSGEAVLKLFTVSGATIFEWFQNRAGAPVAGSFASNWLKEWGLDLSVIGEDHLIRNSSSYRPNELAPLASDARACSAFLRELWTLLQPSTTRFETLDRHLLRMLVKKTFVSSTGKKASWLSLSFRAHVSPMLNALGMADSTRKEFQKFFGTRSPEPELLTKAEALGPPNEPNAHERVIARAALLLRVASGCTAQLIDRAPFTTEDLAFWTSPLAERRAFWSSGSELSNLSDLWQDVADAVEDEETWMQSRPPGTIEMYDWRSQREGVIRPLGECDRVGLWGLVR